MIASPASPAFSPELRLLLTLARGALGRDGAPPDATGVDWRRFVAAVERHRLAPFLLAHAGTVLAAHCPRDVVERVRASAVQSLRRSLAQTAELFRLTDALAAAGISSFTIKGVVLAQQLHGQPAARFSGDLDLVVTPHDAGAADAALQAAGLRRTWPEFPLTPRQLSAFVRAKPDFEYQLAHSDEPLRIELLWRLEGAPADHAVTTVSLAGRDVRTLSLGDHALLLFQHGARHAWFRLFWLVDIARLLERDDLDWAALRLRACAAGSERALRQGVALAVELFGSPIPAALADAPASGRLLAEARRQIVRTPRRNESIVEWMRQLRYRLRLARGASAKWRVLVPHLFTPGNWRVWRLPDRWFWLYYPATPFLWLWRLLRRR
ncbi:MAG: nucleotidyltransferase family protein [Candidatus Didemnitutus sp.]|nr:nucleotidyltransferase family protein [Candidatus Didemnitutus sp.]